MYSSPGTGANTVITAGRPTRGHSPLCLYAAPGQSMKKQFVLCLQPKTVFLTYLDTNNYVWCGSNNHNSRLLKIVKAPLDIFFCGYNRGSFNFYFLFWRSDWTYGGWCWIVWFPLFHSKFRAWHESRRLKDCHTWEITWGTCQFPPVQHRPVITYFRKSIRTSPWNQSLNVFGTLTLIIIISW